jgi:hypothetical protein
MLLIVTLWSWKKNLDESKVIYKRNYGEILQLGKKKNQKFSLNTKIS